MSAISRRYIETYEKINTLSNSRFWQKGKVTLVVVTKNQPVEKCLEVISAGATSLGENYPEEAVQKYTTNVLNKIQLHFIGHLQSRKISLLERVFSYWHTIDEYSSAKKVSNRFYENGRD
jgi:uncharacterized pyridoxal phosphate-containing UPF0001 family protein